MDNQTTQEIEAIRSEITELHQKFGQEMKHHNLNYDQAKEMLNYIKELNNKLQILMGLR